MRRITFLGIILTATFLASCSPSQQGAATKVRIAYLPNIHALPFYLALEKGYFKDEGLDVEIVKFEAPNQIIDALLSDQVGVAAPGAAAGITAVSQSKKPGTIKIVSVQGGTATLKNEAFVVKKGSTIKSFTDLKGKKLGILPGIQWQTIARDILAKNGLTSGTDVTVVDLAIPLQVPALASGQVDALLAIEPSPTIAVAKDIGEIAMQSPTIQFIADPFYAGVGDITTKFASENPELTEKILRVFDKSTDEVNANPDAARQYLKGYTALDDSLINSVPLLQYKTYKDIDEKDIAALQAFYDIFAEYGVIDGKIDARSLIYTDSR
ncbi:ABC transporter substrate-binding protein [Candidatus Peregrinibacteria bacterium]|nr:ABC transporter substrate-binding protein [Candidatus Peregrinibacteria bacterium]